MPDANGAASAGAAASGGAAAPRIRRTKSEILAGMTKGQVIEAREAKDRSIGYESGPDFVSPAIQDEGPMRFVDAAERRDPFAADSAPYRNNFTREDDYWRVRLPLEEAHTLHPKVYYDVDFYEQEQQQVFESSWTCFTLLDRVRRPGDTVQGHVGTQPVFVTRTKKGELRGFLNVCRHRGSQLVLEDGRYSVISCPYHRWGYALDGRLLATPMWDMNAGRKEEEDGGGGGAVAGSAVAGKRRLKGRKAREAAAAAAKRLEDGGGPTRLDQLRSQLAAEDAEQKRKDAAFAERMDEAEALAVQNISPALGGFSPSGRECGTSEDDAAAEAARRFAANAGAAAGDADAQPCGQLASINEELAEAFDTSHLRSFDKKDYGLLQVRVEAWGPFVFVCADPDAPSLAECLGDLPDTLSDYPLSELVSVRRKTFDVAANWKLLQENFMEYYHLPAVHPDLCLVSGVDQHARAQGRGQYVGFVTRPLTRGGTAIDPGTFPPFADVVGTPNEDTAWFHHLFPNVFYFLFPDHMFTVISQPTGPSETREHADLLVHPTLLAEYEEHGTVHGRNVEETLDTLVDRMFEFYDNVNMEDIVACERVQVGVAARHYTGGRISFRFEETIHRFQNMVVDHMVGARTIPEGDCPQTGEPRTNPNIRPRETLGRAP
jgi:phenylpropionate dioxygenase-like ring-hydroxylating dioxygenase large terminal subunit